MNREVAARLLGYSGLSGASLPVLSALRKYGLLEGRGEEIRVSDAAVTIIADTGADDQSERRQALRDAIMGDKLFASLHDRFGESGSEMNITAYLTKAGFQPDGAAKAAKSYVESIAFVTGELDGYNLSEDAGNIANNAETDVGKVNKSSVLHGKKLPERSNMQQDTFNLDEGMATLEWPKSFSKESYEDFAGWLRLIMGRAKRSITEASPEDAPKAD